MSTRTIIFAGAPDPRQFGQDIASPLQTFIPPISTFLGQPELESSPWPATAQQPAWRSISLGVHPLESDLPRLHDLPEAVPRRDYQPDDNFFTTVSLSLDSDSSHDSHVQVLSQFYDESLARHEEVRSSQLPGSQEDTASFRTHESTSFNTTAEGEISTVSARAPLAGSSHLSDLEDIPTAKDLLALAPATVTSNIIAGIISISQPREVKTRYGHRMLLVELLLGDETRSGFSVTFWLTPQTDDGTFKRPLDVAQAALLKLRRQDVIMLQNVALHVFRGKVYGQSLRKNLTKVHLLHRRKLSEQDDGGYYRLSHFKSTSVATDPQLDKTRKVRDWVLHFVGGDRGTSFTTATRAATAGEADDLDLPPEDTQ